MMQFLLRRCAYSFLVVFGVVVLTFLMFRLAAGDPAAAVLGKSPRPEEVESLRRELGSDLPLFWGHWRRSEVYAKLTFNGDRAYPDVQLPEPAHFAADGALQLAPGETVTWQQLFPVAESVRATITGEGDLRVGEQTVSLPANGRVQVEFEPRESWRITGVGAAAGKVITVTFERYQSSGFQSQFFASLREIVDVRPEFPYVSVLNFGNALTTREPIRAIIARGMGPSLSLMLPIFLGEMLLGIALALAAVAAKDSIWDRTMLLLAVGGMSVSYLVLIIFGQWFFGYYCNFFPVWGWGDWRYLALPVLIGIASGLGGSVRFYRTVLVNELNKEYLRTAAAKGCSPFKVYSTHLLRNAMIPIIARASTILPFLFTGSLLLESFFGIPGLGYAGIEALNNSDLQLLKALTIVNALLFVLMNLLADLAYGWADPRVRPAD